jgi:endonuclease III
LEINNTECKLTILPDGIYEIKFSIDPNEKYMAEFNHMRVCKLMSNYIKLVGLYLSNKSSNTNRENEEIEKEFTTIKEIIDSSVYAVEEYLDNSLGLDLYEQASKRINNINNGKFAGCCK